jgi:hypothetical protein
MKIAVTRPAVLLKPVQYVFIFSHMRSRSTLLSHVMGSHAEISGYVEAHISYKSRLDFLRLRKRVSDSLNGAPLARYVLDKVLHNWYLAPRAVEEFAIRPIFLVRRPEESIKSIYSITKSGDASARMSNATNHYLKRLRWQVDCCRALSTRGVFVESGSLVNRTGDVFRLLQDQLELASPLSESYQVFSETGKPVMGDPSDMIRAGQIVRDGRTSYEQADDAPPDVPADMLRDAQAAYDRCVATLSKRCWHVH